MCVCVCVCVCVRVCSDLVAWLLLDLYRHQRLIPLKGSLHYRGREQGYRLLVSWVGQ